MPGNLCIAAVWTHAYISAQGMQYKLNNPGSGTTGWWWQQLGCDLVKQANACGLSHYQQGSE